MLFFPSLGAFGGGGHIVVYLGLEGLGVLCYLFLFFICLGFVFVLNCSVLFCWWIVFGVVFFWGGGRFFICFFVVCFALFCVGVFWSCLVFVFLYIFGLFLCCSLCCLEWSRCCYCFVFLVCFA